MRRSRQPLADAYVMGDDEKPVSFWGNDRVRISNVIHPSSGRRTYPEYVFIETRLGDDHVYARVDLTWREVKALHSRLGLLLQDRAALQRGVARTKRS